MSADVDTNLIIENLTELLQNTVNMTSVFYDIFINPNPMDVALTQFDANGELITVLVPNRAKYMQRALTGNDAPEGVVAASEGTLYIDEQDQAVYVKALGSDANGWKAVLTEAGVYAYVRSYLENSDYLDTVKLAQYLTTEEYTTETRVAEMIGDSTFSAFIENLPSSGTILLRDNKHYKLEADGDVEFILPNINDLGKLHSIYIQFEVTNPENEVTLGTDFFFNKILPDFSTEGTYDIKFEYDNFSGAWVCEVVFKGIGEYETITQLYDKVNSMQIGEGNISFQRNGDDIGYVNVNQEEDATINISVPTTAEDIGALPDDTTISDLATEEQMAAIDSGVNSTIVEQVGTNANAISNIEALIPSQATTSNQLADKAFVNSSIATSTATFRGTFNSVAALEAYSGEKDDNDYAFVVGTDAAGNTYYDRYKYTGTSWVFEYRLNNSSFTAAQWAAISSGITANEVTQIASNTAAISNLQNDKQNKLTAGSNIQINGSTISATDTTYSKGSGLNLNGTTFSVNFTEVATAAQGAKADTALQSGDNISELNNNAGYITGITSTMVTGALGFTPYNSTNPSGYQANVLETVKVNGTALTATSKTVDVTVPTKVSQLTNDSSFISSITSSDVTTALGFTPATAAQGAKADSALQSVPIAGINTLGGVKIGSNLTISADGTLSANAQAVTVDSTLSTTSTNPVQNKVVTGAINDKQDKLTAGSGITINNNTITATGMSVPIDDALSTTSTNPVQNKVITGVINDKQDKLIAGAGITINNNTITATGTSVVIDDSLSTTSTNPVQNKVITNSINDLQSNKQNTLIAGTGITISGNTITATGMSVPIDDALSTTSINPAQNKVITSAIDSATSVAESKSTVMIVKWS